jgi:putative ABC transport system permease protein
MAALLVTLGAIAALLAAIGIYGLISASVTERTRELGIRLALGATARQAVQSVAGIGVALAAAGAVVGTLASMWVVRFIGSLLWGVQPTDPLTFATVGFVLLVVAAIASTIPALRVLRLDPSETLRAQ